MCSSTASWMAATRRPRAAPDTCGEIQKQMRTIGVGRIASVSGRYYAMDRDKRWERIERAFGAMVLGNGEKATDPVGRRQALLRKGVTDEFIEPVTIVDDRGEPVGLIRDEDAVIFFNFRADRGREMTVALTDTKLERPSRSLAPKNLHYVTMTQYDKTFTLPFVLPREHPNNILANVMAQLNWKNLRVAETEKYAHVTYFFNGGNEKPYPGEERELVPSPKVATYDLKPEMSAAGITDVVVKAIERRRLRRDRDELRQRRHGGPLRQDGADGARGGSRGRLPGAHLPGAARAQGGAWIITADHGNAEMMIDPVTKVRTRTTPPIRCRSFW